ncbi:PepSY domain-containing protein [Mycolicibacterium austroafricanum]|nr:PepSY-associated TM helix domain-containing protein [Mycolicibacterium austroafricanum]PQP41023.1 peptidase [Mycolicibacterium austroafricanum]QRZ07591.1 PepSY domain-containing protein [Mycolicibacterium austroafricanum]QZT69254.1 PepSY domain-containing protein [Mycolicibacterium austroafricanum]
MSITETELRASSRHEARNTFHSFFMRLHFYAGVFIGPFLLIATVSGGLYAIAPTVEQWVYRDYLHVESSGAALPLAEQVLAAQQVQPELTVAAVRPAVDPGETTRVLFTDPSLGPSERHAVFIDPTSAESLGELTVYGNSGALPLRTWIDQLHRSLHLGDPGRVYSELAASWLWIIALGGVYLWVSRYRRMRAQGSTQTRLLTADRTATGRRRTLSWHGAVGIWIAAGLLFLSATGLTWSMYAGANITELRSALSWTTPSVSKTLPDSADDATDGGSDHDGHDHGAGQTTDAAAPSQPRVGDLDRVLASARAAGIGGKVEVSIPSEATTAFTVTQTRQPWVMSNNAVAVDGATGSITDVVWFADWPLAAKLAAWGIQLHMGLLFGLINQLALVALAIGLVTVIVRGYLMWWRRRPTRGGAAMGRAPRRGALSTLSPGVAVVVVLAWVTIGWFVPLLGLSLAMFVVVDAAVGVVQNRQHRSSPSDDAARA